MPQHTFEKEILHSASSIQSFNLSYISYSFKVCAQLILQIMASGCYHDVITIELNSSVCSESLFPSAESAGHQVPVL